MGEVRTVRFTHMWDIQQRTNEPTKHRNKLKTKLIDADVRTGVAEGKGGAGGRVWWGQIRSDGGKLPLSGEHTTQYADDVAESCTPETYVILLTHVTPIHFIIRNGQLI